MFLAPHHYMMGSFTRMHFSVTVILAVLITSALARGQQDSSRIGAETVCKEAAELRKVPGVESQRKSIEKFEQCASLWHATSDRGREADALFQIAAIYRSLGDTHRALNSGEAALALRRLVNESASLAETLSFMGALYSTLGETEKALSVYNEALTLAHAAGDRQVEGRTLIRVGLHYASIGERQKAIDSYSQAIPLTQ